MSNFSATLQQRLEPARTYWNHLQPREQLWLKIGGAMLAIAMAYYVIWVPIQGAKQAAQVRVDSQRELLSWVQANTARYQELSGGRTGTSQSTISGSLTQKFNRIAGEANVSVSRTQPQGDDLLVVMDQVSFDQLLRLVQQLQTRAGVQVVQLDVAESGTPGQVRVRRMRVAEVS